MSEERTNELFEAIKTGDANRVAKLLDEDRTLLEARHGNTSAILLAVYHGKADIARLFADRGAVLSLHEACALGELARVQDLLNENPALLDSYSEDGYAVFGFATFFGHPEVDRFLLGRNPDVNAQARNEQHVGAAHAAAAARNHEIMRLILERGANPNARQAMDYTPMHTAASRGDFEMAKLLLSFGAEPKAKGSDGKTPADIAREHGMQVFADWIETC